MEQREQAQKVALEALRNASATENVVRIYKYVQQWHLFFLWQFDTVWTEWLVCLSPHTTTANLLGARVGWSQVRPL